MQYEITDISVTNWLHEHTSPALTTAMRAITVLGSPLFVNAIMIVAIGLLLFRRQYHVAVLLGLCVWGGMVVNTGVKNIFDRTRPHFEPALTVAYGYSFPSGHVAAATLFYGCIIVLVLRQKPPLAVRIAVVSILFLLVQLISVSRIYLGVHYLTDVLAAQLLGVVWLAFSFTAVEIIRRRRDASRSVSPTGTSR